jgi:hypothetical protein
MEHISPPGSRTRRLWQAIDQAADTIRPQPLMSIAIGGSVAKLQGACIPRPAQKYAPRGVIKGFSAASRKRLIELMASINRSAVRWMPLFVTLTYPAIWPDDPKVWKEHLDTFLKRVERKYVGLSAVWKLEFQQRAAPHFHIILFGARWLDAHWVARAWYAAVGSGDHRHLQAGTEVKRVRSWRGVMSYASKYLAKKTQENIPAFPGRFWGIFGRAHLPIEYLVVPMEFGQFYRARRLLIKGVKCKRGAIQPGGENKKKAYCPKVRGQHQGVTIFGDYLNLLQYLRPLAIVSRETTP